MPSYTIIIMSGEKEVTVRGTCHRARRGLRDELGRILPDEPGHFEITDAVDEDGNRVQLTDSERRAIEEFASRDCW